jgi:hypothetical protein
MLTILRQEFFLQSLAEKLGSLPRKVIHKRKTLDWALRAYSPSTGRTHQKRTAAGPVQRTRRSLADPSGSSSSLEEESWEHLDQHQQADHYHHHHQQDSTIHNRCPPHTKKNSTRWGSVSL